jgi:peptide/nickel transport system permease protein
VRFLIRRALYALFLLAGVSLLTFMLAELAPGDFLSRMRLDPEVGEETIELMNERLGLDRSPAARYLYWLRSIAELELGYSYRTGGPVAGLVGPAARNTLLLSGLATFLAWAIALPVGVWAADRRGRTGAALVSGATSLLLAVPDVLLALALLLLAVRTGWFPTGGMASLGFAELGWLGRLTDLIHHAALPVTALVLTIVPTLVRHVQSAFGEVLDSPFLRAVRGAGIPRRRRLLRYALPAAANPLVSLFGLSIASLLSASLLIEVVMSWPGIGPLMIAAVLDHDVYVVLAVVLASTALLLLGNLTADVALYALDPRIRREDG